MTVIEAIIAFFVTNQVLARLIGFTLGLLLLLVLVVYLPYAQARVIAAFAYGAVAACAGKTYLP